MMAYIGEWVKHIVLLILIASFLDLLLPNGHMRRYVKMVVGLLIIMLILSPILDLMKIDQDRIMSAIEELFDHEQERIDYRIDEHKQNIEELQKEAIIEEVEKKWADQLTQSLEEQFSIQVVEVNVELQRNGEDVEKVTIVAYDDDAQQTSNSDSVDGEAVQPVQPVQIDVSGQTNAESGQENDASLKDSQKSSQRASQSRSRDELKIEDKVLTYFLDKWNISEDKITFSWLRR